MALRRIFEPRWAGGVRPSRSFVASIAFILSCSAELSVGEVLPRGDSSVVGIGGADAGYHPRDVGGVTDASVRDDRDAAVEASICRAAQSPCTQSEQCCSRFCISGTCVQPVTCQRTGTCTQSSSCCSDRCEPGMTTLTCRTVCSADGVACTRPQDCCSLGCSNGVCGGGFCKAQGAACAANSECCSFICDSSTRLCRRVGDDADECQPAGEACGAGSTNIVCCSGTCDATLGRCAFPTRTCHGLGASCAQSSDCCMGECLPDAQNQRTCRIRCLADDTACTTSAECCNFGCSGSPAVCGPPIGADPNDPPCTSTNGSCSSHAACCSKYCALGFCDLPCQLAGISCRVAGDCCSGICASGVCQRAPAP